MNATCSNTRQPFKNDNNDKKNQQCNGHPNMQAIQYQKKEKKKKKEDNFHVQRLKT